MSVRLPFWIGVTLVIPATGVWIWCTSGDWGTWLLTVAVLGIAAWTLDATVLRPPKLWISKPDELGHNDLIFYFFEHNGERVPRDYLLQLHALLGNMGGKQAVITSIKLTAFKTHDGKQVHLPELPKTIDGHRYSTWTSWRDVGPSFDRRLDPPPFILGPNDVLIVRFRGRRGVDWSGRWSLEALKVLHDSLAAAPTRATLEVVYRWGRHKKRITKDIPLEIAQHKEYVNQLRSLTSNFTKKPDLPEQKIAIE